MKKRILLYLIGCQETARPRCQSAFDGYNGCPSGLMRIAKKTKSPPRARRWRLVLSRT